MNYRHLTPSMSLLLAFEAAARHESYTRAAVELSLTQSAVSRQVQALEEQLGLTLFRREGRQVRLTDVGRLYQREMSEALGRIRSATLQAMAYQSGSGTLRLATLPTFGSKWLLPRLHEFYKTHPGILVHISSRIDAIDFDTSGIDAAIVVGTADLPGLISHRLHAEELIVIISAQAAKTHETWTPERISEQMLLNVANNPNVWGDWFSHYTLPHARMRLGPSFELTSHLIQAVRADIGIGLVPRILVADELANGELIGLDLPFASRRSYYLTYPPRNEMLPSLRAFRGWLLEQI
ncbi:LysR family transcriptional regulator [Pseudomonas mediterranea]|uniref:DNA-binding transcriptional regulator, LysR family n=1 Tax=Pseudomonas mediterranea TaxID=183795 RepID=A0AAX2DEV6_9PSED|nr:LysR substrate-binding domain-containing protein [Pseudomonas mediterranea]KGU82472.1 LysR family transcriptional regulator [Pseudomonas mediterranea CFBP 5447]MBL0844506.1 LysR family transcriptional regulator [Pseudomonas mediterranea]MDU9030409.1 LysR substrate-binding domain-containing protein [Pseudomonas mediterranea]QHA82401.1 LysR family transcriptional regulator [Pseudomonas mediterranea]UZE03215.1 LysR substrate-binding domain-containing protein [Pseudomonas mediterranea]